MELVIKNAKIFGRKFLCVNNSCTVWHLGQHCLVASHNFKMFAVGLRSDPFLCAQLCMAAVTVVTWGVWWAN